MKECNSLCYRTGLYGNAGVIIFAYGEVPGVWGKMIDGLGIRGGYMNLPEIKFRPKVFVLCRRRPGRERELRAGEYGVTAGGEKNHQHKAKKN